MPMKSSSKFRLLLVAVVALLCATVSLAGPITLTIYPNIQPNPTMSPDWAAFYTTAITAIGNDASSGGAGVSRYEVISEFYPGDVVSSSGFHSWRGLVPGAYADQHGNYLGFGLHVVGDGAQQFSLAGLSYAMSSNDAGSGCPAGTSGSWCRTGGYNTPDYFTTYNAYTVGLNYGIDRARGGGDDTIYTAGDAQALIDELIFVGVAGTFDASLAPGATPQDQIDNLISYINSWNFTADIEYCMHWGTQGATCAQSSVGVISEAIPEPGTAALFAVGLMALLAARRLRRRGV